MFFIIFMPILSYLIYHYLSKPNYWKKRGVVHVKPWPIIGNMGSNFFGKKSIGHILQDCYNAFPDKRYIGFFNSTLPELFLRDPQLIKQIAIKESDVFSEHRPFLPDGIDPLWSNNLFAMKGGERWHNMRSTLSPAFTSSKLKNMFGLMKECTSNFSDFYLKKGGLVSLEMKEAFGRYGNDVIASTAFGVACDSFNEPNNEFYLNGISLTRFNFMRGLVMFGYILFPSLCKFLKIKMFPPEAGAFFSNVIKETIKLKQSKVIVRPDLVHLLMEARKSNVNQDAKKAKFTLTDDDITAQALVFHFGGLDTTSTMLSHTAHELAINPDIQAKLHQEVKDTLAACKGNITYESLNAMKYLDMVLSESLRKWPPFVASDRVAQKPFTIEPELANEKPLHISAGQICNVPIFPIQRDPKYFPNPECFDPERFSEENKHNIAPFTFIPFGVGPRNCIGSRLALLQGKMMLLELVSKFEIVTTEKTQIPLEISKVNFLPVPDEGFWLGLKPRSKYSKLLSRNFGLKPN